MRLKIFKSRYNFDIDNGEDSVDRRDSVASSLEVQSAASSSQKTQEQSVNVSSLNSQTVSQEGTSTFNSSTLGVQPVHSTPSAVVPNVSSVNIDNRNVCQDYEIPQSVLDFVNSYSPSSPENASEVAHCSTSTQLQGNGVDISNEQQNLNSSGFNQPQDHTLRQSNQAYYNPTPQSCHCNQCLTNLVDAYFQGMDTTETDQQTYNNSATNCFAPNSNLYQFEHPSHPQMTFPDGQPIPGSSNSQNYLYGESLPESYRQTAHFASPISEPEGEEVNRCVGMEVYSVLNTCIQQIGHLIASTPLKFNSSALLIPLCEVAKKSLKIQQQFNTSLLTNGHQNHPGTFCDFGKHSEASNDQTTEVNQTTQSSRQDRRFSSVGGYFVHRY